jgi:hypothetical protein
VLLDGTAGMSHQSQGFGLDFIPLFQVAVKLVATKYQVKGNGYEREVSREIVQAIAPCEVLALRMASSAETTAMIYASASTMAAISACNGISMKCQSNSVCRNLAMSSSSSCKPSRI